MGARREVVSAVTERSLRLRSACPFEAELIRQADAEGSARSFIGYEVRGRKCLECPREPSMDPVRGGVNGRGADGCSMSTTQTP
jgi:hypothetical protein